MGQYKHHAFVGTSGGMPVESLRHVAPPGDNSLVD
jgi:hypothetical protein